MRCEVTDICANDDRLAHGEQVLPFRVDHGVRDKKSESPSASLRTYLRKQGQRKCFKVLQFFGAAFLWETHAATPISTREQALSSSDDHLWNSCSLIMCQMKCVVKSTCAPSKMSCLLLSRKSMRDKVWFLHPLHCAQVFNAAFSARYLHP